MIIFTENKRKKEPAVRNAPEIADSPLFVTGSSISISELLDLSRSHFPDVLPESVLRHYGYDACPEGELGETALYSHKMHSPPIVNTGDIA